MSLSTQIQDLDQQRATIEESIATHEQLAQSLEAEAQRRRAQIADLQRQLPAIEAERARLAQELAEEEARKAAGD